MRLKLQIQTLSGKLLIFQDNSEKKTNNSDTILKTVYVSQITFAFVLTLEIHLKDNLQIK